MTVKEALNILHTYENGGHSIPVRTEALTIAIEAIEKQMPKKPYLVELKGRADYAVRLYAKRCPVCGENIDQYGVPHCEYCGQALDWSEEE